MAPFLLLALLLGSACSGHGLTVWPKPTSVKDTGVTYQLDGASFDFKPTGLDSELLQNAMRRYAGMIFGRRPAASSEQQAQLDLLETMRAAGTLSERELIDLRGRLLGARNGTNPSESAIDATTIAGCDIDVTSDEAAKTLETDESYTLTVAAPRIKLSAPTVFGAIYGLETLSQLVEDTVFINGTVITDKPRYAFRATMIDTSRHFYPLEAIFMHIDAMAYSKMNVLHWHIVDSISFPFESITFPTMSVEGAYTQSHVYTHGDIRTVINFAMERGVRVVPEFDTPGHVYRGWESLGVLTRCYDESGKPADTGPLNPTINKTYDVIQGLYAEIQQVFAPEKFVHTGGDEVPFDCWTSNPQIKKWMAANSGTVKNFADLETLYEQRLIEILDNQNTSYIVWQELFDNGAKLAKDTVIDVWKGGNWQEEMSKVSAAGFHSVLSAPFYLNYISYGPDWPKYYLIEPSNFTGGAAAESKNLVGGVEACFWSEYIDATNFIPRAWPRTAAVAERGWSAKDVRDLADAQARLHEWRCKLINRGINGEPLGTCGNEGCNSNLSSIRLPGYGGYCPNEYAPPYTPWK